ncbi:hypothetical protein DENIS_0215 [Desulfonema ishimotonii]|uniref:Uncharacterized protein n=1 Tax=Desulfonema ishimotonii TaxID=45657 RepID=A0A401FQL2_9BACT|nr:hypothetical protein DENIS_0215 [Desulfonema ishimotonii]
MAGFSPVRSASAARTFTGVAAFFSGRAAGARLFLAGADATALFSGFFTGVTGVDTALFGATRRAVFSATGAAVRFETDSAVADRFPFSESVAGFWTF